jgi:hypothetical protein
VLIFKHDIGELFLPNYRVFEDFDIFNSLAKFMAINGVFCVDWLSRRLVYAIISQKWLSSIMIIRDID